MTADQYRKFIEDICTYKIQDYPVFVQEEPAVGYFNLLPWMWYFPTKGAVIYDVTTT